MEDVLDVDPKENGSHMPESNQDVANPENDGIQRLRNWIAVVSFIIAIVTSEDQNEPFPGIY